MKFRTAAALAAIVVLAGCGGRPGGISDAMKYDARSISHVKMDDDTYRIFEHPQRDRIMTTTSLGKAAGQGFVRGATFGMADVQTPEQRHEAAARRYLGMTNRSECTIRSGYELVQTQYEFMIDCPEGTVATKAPSVSEQVHKGRSAASSG